MTACKNTQNKNVNLYLDMKCCILLIYPKKTQARMIENLTKVLSVAQESLET